MTDKQSITDPIATAARLLREAAEELRQAHAFPGIEGWENETDAKAAYDEHMAAAQALEDWEAAVGAGGVQALSAAPAGWKLVPVEPTVDQEWAGKNAALRCSTMGEACKIYKAMLAASPTPPAEQQAAKVAPAIGDELRDTLVAVSAAIAEQDDRTAQKMIREILEASPTPPAEQATTTEAATPKAGVTTGAALGGVYAELPQPDSWFHFTPQYWENTLRDFADRTHALRMEQAAPKAATVKACVCGEPQAPGTVHRVDGPCYVAAPQQEAQEPSHRETVDVVGVRSNGEHVNLGKIAMPPRMKAREVAIEQFGSFKDDDGSDAEMCFGALEYFLEWLIQQGWSKAPQPAPAPLGDDVVRDAAFDAVRKKLCALPRFSFLSDGYGVRRVPDKSGSWIAFDAAHALFDPVAVDAALAAQGGK